MSHHKGEHSAVFCEYVADSEAPRAILNPFKKITRQNGRRIKNPDEPMFTITVTDRHGVVHRGRTVITDGEPWFVGKDVAVILGYSKPRNAIAMHVDCEDKKVAPIQGDLGGTQQMIIINESGLYSLILSSKMPKARDTLLFNILSYMSNQLLGRGNTVAAIDELYLFLTNMTSIEYIRNGMKRVRKKESSFILASQNIEDFLLPEIKEFIKPPFSIPSHHFLFNPGNISPADFVDTLQVEHSDLQGKNVR